MTADAFVTTVEAHFGRYEHAAMRASVLLWASTYAYALDRVWNETLRTFSGQYGKTPDIAVFESAAKAFDGSNAWGGRVGWQIALRPKADVPAIADTQPKPLTGAAYDAMIEGIRQAQTQPKPKEKSSKGTRPDEAPRPRVVLSKAKTLERDERIIAFVRQAAELEGTGL